MRILVFALLVACGRPHVATPPSDFQADVDLLERIANALHPGLTRYNTPADVHRLFARARASNPRTRGEQFLRLTELTAALRCGHTFPNFANQSEDVERALFHANRLPFLFRWIDGEMVITDDLGAGLPVGTRVRALGKVSTADILATLMPLARGDGANDAKRRAYLEVRGDGAVEPFDVLASLAFPALFAGRMIELAVITPDGKPSTIAAPLISFDEHARAIASRQPQLDANAPLWTTQRMGRAMVLRMPTWVAYKTKWDWKGDLERMQLDHVDGLIVDLRGNEGGNYVGDILLARVIDRPIEARKLSRRVRFASVPADLRPFLDTWDPSFFDLGKDARDLGGGWRELPPSDAATIEPKGPRFTGKLIVLIDAANSSATFQFAQIVRDHKLGTLVGTTTGGSQRGINGGAFFFARLPRTGIEVDIPLIGTFPTAEMPDRGITPDIVVEATAADIAAGRDRVLETALALIEKR